MTTGTTGRGTAQASHEHINALRAAQTLKDRRRKLWIRIASISATIAVIGIVAAMMLTSRQQTSSVARVTRTSVLESLGDDYVRTARALGTPELVILFRHALRNSALPLITILGISLGRQFGGTVIMETTFSLPGMGTVLIQGINGRDYPLVQGVILVFAMMFIFVNLLTDLVYTRVDPRVRLG